MAYPNFHKPLAVTSTTKNSTTTALTNGSTFTGDWEFNAFSDVFIGIYTDQDTDVTLQFSHDGVTVDSSFPTNKYTAKANTYLPRIAVKGLRYFRILLENNSGADQTIMRCHVDYGEYGQLNSPLNQSIALDADATLVRPSDFQDEVRRGKRTGVTGWNKFGYRTTLQAASGEQTVWAAPGNYVIPTSADTFNIAYDGTAGGSTDGSGTTGATELTFYYIDSNGLPAITAHTLGTDGTDTTSFSGLGINRCEVSANGGIKYNASDITITHTTSGNTMAFLPATQSVTQQCIFHTGSNHTAIAPYLRFNVNKLSGSNPKVTVLGYVYNRNINTRFEVFREILDTQSNTFAEFNDPIKFPLNPTDVLYFVADTDQNNTVITMRFSLNEYQIS